MESSGSAAPETGPAAEATGGAAGLAAAACAARGGTRASTTAAAPMTSRNHPVRPTPLVLTLTAPADCHGFSTNRTPARGPLAKLAGARGLGTGFAYLPARRAAGRKGQWQPKT